MLLRYQHLTNPTEQVDAAGKENVLFGLESLQTYPSVKRRLEEGTLRLHAWFFKIASAELSAYDPTTHQFLPLVGPRQMRFDFDPGKPEK